MIQKGDKSMSASSYIVLKNLKDTNQSDTQKHTETETTTEIHTSVASSNSVKLHMGFDEFLLLTFTPQQIANILGHSDLKMLFEHYAKWLKDKAIDANTSINLYESLNKDYKQVTV